MKNKIYLILLPLIFSIWMGMTLGYAWIISSSIKLQNEKIYKFQNSKNFCNKVEDCFLLDGTLLKKNDGTIYLNFVFKYAINATSEKINLDDIINLKMRSDQNIIRYKFKYLIYNKDNDNFENLYFIYKRDQKFARFYLENKILTELLIDQ